MAWLSPVALAALALIAAPIAVHMLVRRHARRVVFPAVRFVNPSRAASMTVQRPTDVGLMLLRIAIVAAAATAAAQPLLLTSHRVAMWNGRVSKAIVVDRGSADHDRVQRLIAAERASAADSIRLDTGSIGDGLDRAAAWLAGRPPSRREIVVISSFPAGSIGAADVRRVPGAIGVRFVRGGVLPAARTVAWPTMSGWRGRVWTSEVTLDATMLRATWRASGAAARPAWLRVSAAPRDADAADRAFRAATAGGVAERVGLATELIFAGAASLQPVEPLSGSAAASIQRLRGQPLFRDVMRDSTGVALAVPAHVAAIARTGDGHVAAWAGQRTDTLIIAVPFAASSPLAPAMIRAVLDAVPDPFSSGAFEVRTVPDATLAAWQREPEPVSRDAWPNAERSDGRWLWGLALALLGCEVWVRRPRRQREDAVRHAA